ncbi:tetratricopeptide repeat protein [Ideonella sp. A 288]|uniref:tetratricopeptide repeat protein n=1 Tax=Ideonella sp. A 288 TaxID=1962181 RepID=UPI000B4B2512|nr:tetratricopeptide repeat protein [Ideonella sp. A 288]
MRPRTRAATGATSPRLRGLVLTLLAGGLAGCGLFQRPPAGDDAPTLASLAQRRVDVVPDAGPPRDEARAIAAYQAFLAIAPTSPGTPGAAAVVGRATATQAVPALRGDPRQALGADPMQAQRVDPTQALRAVAMRRLGDLEMDLADKRAGDGDAPDYGPAIARYQAYLAAHPTDPGNDRVLYQLARAQEQGGQPEAALKTLDRLVAAHPLTAHRDEAEFRRGELLFSARRYEPAEAAYGAVLQAGAGNPFLDRALYMQGWSRYKQGRLDEALDAFFGVLDVKLGGRPTGDDSGDERPIAELPGLTRADRELLEDTLRVVSLSLDGLQGAASIAGHVHSDRREAYAWRVYEQLGELYLRQGRSKDAADTFARFAQVQPTAPQAPLAQSRVIAIYEASGFDGLALAAKRDFVVAHGAASAMRQSNPAGWLRAQPRVHEHLAALARHHHAVAQTSRREADVDEAVRWYGALLEAFPNDRQAPAARFLLAELLAEAGRHAPAAAEYERSAYAPLRHAHSADAGYAALLARGELVKRADAADRPALQRAQVDSARRFAAAFADDPRRAAVMTGAADTLFALRDIDASTALAREVLALQPPAAATQRRVAWTVVAHGAFERSDFAAAEAAYGEVLALVPAQDGARAELVDRQAAAIYRQGEAAREGGRTQDAVGHFGRVAAVAPQSAVGANAQIDAAAAMIALKDWTGAARTLEDFRRRHASHPLAAGLPARLALVYTELGRWGPAAAEFDRLAATLPDTGVDAEAARAARWRAAELHEKAGDRATAGKAFAAYLQRHPQPLEAAVEARWRLAAMAEFEGRAKDAKAWLDGLRQADAGGGDARTPRTRTLGALAALQLAEAPAQAYRQVALVEPLARTLKLKKARFDEALQAYARAADTGVAEGASAATFHSAALYQDFGRAVLASQRPRPKGRPLGKAEAEQYQVMLEEQAFPFEEKAIELHALNAQRTAQGLYDGWVRKSYAALRELRPLRYGKDERVAPLVAAATTDANRPAAAGPRTAASWNAEGIAHREAGRFAEAQAAYERALALDGGYAPALLNLGILWDLYLHDGARALAQYDAYQRVSGGDATVDRWIADLRNRKPQHALATHAKEPAR